MTGGTGFIGQKLVPRLVARGDTVRLLSRSIAASEQPSRIEHCQCDLLSVQTNDLASMLEGVEVLYHCAGQLTNPQTMRALHVDATHKLVKAASGRVNHWVQLSSVGVYGSVKAGIITEDSVLNPTGLYEITKAESDKIVALGSKNGGFSHSILRPSNVFGPEMSNQSLYKMVSMIDKGWFFYIGKRGASANYIHVDNVVSGLIRCGTMNAAKDRVFNISDHRTLEQFVGVIADALARSTPRWRIPFFMAYLAGVTLGNLPSFPLTRSRVDALANFSIYSISRIQQELGYREAISMEQGLRELVAEYQKRFSQCELK
ncbi:MAG: NAD-dependent epimerase/dehydratase family protein [Gallionella sp.]|nr:NAD-dependent epimerase/dehydratase family protein [Gallionella sp.]